MSVSRETEERFRDYSALILKWNPHINLVASSTLPDVEERHIADCRQISAATSGAEGRWLDIGSGGGLPGIVISILAQDRDLQVTLIESDQRKAEFLRTVQRHLSLERLTILAARIEDTHSHGADHLSARALAPLPKLLAYVHHHLAPAGQAWLMKGRNWQAECAQARVDWRFDLTAIPSRTDPNAAILNISGVSHA